MNVEYFGEAPCIKIHRDLTDAMQDFFKINKSQASLFLSIKKDGGVYSVVDFITPAQECGYYGNNIDPAELEELGHDDGTDGSKLIGICRGGEGITGNFATKDLLFFGNSFNGIKNYVAMHMAWRNGVPSAFIADGKLRFSDALVLVTRDRSAQYEKLAESAKEFIRPNKKLSNAEPMKRKIVDPSIITQNKIGWRGLV